MKVVCLFLFFTVCLASDMKVNFNPNSDAAKEHLKEDLEGVIQKNPDEMSMEEMQFHYFREHDYNNDKMLDGNELVTSVLHHQSHDDEGEDAHQMKEDEIIIMIDDIIHLQDKNGDGMLSYNEYMSVA